jgi:hypothetical protein
MLAVVAPSSVPLDAAVHAPFVQVCPAVHAFPHAPQFDTLVLVFVSHPFTAFASQFPYPAAHVGVHAPFEQVFVVAPVGV